THSMALFNQQCSDAPVAAARQATAAGRSLRAVAAQIGCAPSTLSERIKKSKAAEADARALLGIRDRQPRRARASASAALLFLMRSERVEGAQPICAATARSERPAAVAWRAAATGASLHC